jgi:hypothetical protein
LRRRWFMEFLLRKVAVPFGQVCVTFLPTQSASYLVAVSKS